MAEQNTKGNVPDLPTHALIGEPAELRGIPAIAPGVGGVQPGTNPERTLINRHGNWTTDRTPDF